MIRAVLDTNALASGIVGFALAASVLGQVLRAWRDGAFVLIVSEPILAELKRTLRKPYFRRRLSDAQMTALLALLTSEALVQPLTAAVVGVASHPEDDLILATAVSAKAGYLVTGDGKLQVLGTYQGVTILPPRAFLGSLP